MRIGRIALLGLLLLLSCGRHQSESNASSAARLEIRLAAREPQPGFAAMVPKGSQEPIYVAAEPVLTNADVAGTESLSDPEGGAAVSLVFTTEGARKFAEFTTAHVGEKAAILIDGQVVSAPTILDPITSGRAMISAQFTEAEARKLADALAVRK